jgi:hypothetical protein
MDRLLVAMKDFDPKLEVVVQVAKDLLVVVDSMDSKDWDSEEDPVVVAKAKLDFAVEAKVQAAKAKLDLAVDQVEGVVPKVY